MSDNTKAILGALSDKCTCVYVDNGDGDPELLMYHCTQCHAAEWIEALEAERDRLKGDLAIMHLKLEAKLSTEESEELTRLKAENKELKVRIANLGWTGELYR
jgi:hypothetical protein